MSVLLVLIALVSLFLLSLVINASFLWLACKWSKVPRVSYKRALGITLLLAIFGLAIAATGLIPTLAAVPLSYLGLFLVQVVIILGGLRFLLPTSLPRAALVAGISIGLNVAYTVVFVTAVRYTFFEAFVIPTGGMAETLWGYQKLVVCPQCQFHFPVNCSEEMAKKPPIQISGCTCPNCHFAIDFAQQKVAPSCNQGDRVLASKRFFPVQLQRLDAVVFNYPVAPVVDNVPMRYLQRLVGLPGETIGIYYGKLYVLPADKGPRYNESAVNKEDLWKSPYMHEGAANDLLKKPDSPFQIIRKPPAKILALRRIVHDNDHPAQDLNAQKHPPRWAGKGWEADPSHGFRHAGDKGDDVAWLRYRHILRQGTEPELITDFLGYNSKAYATFVGTDVEHPLLPANWVGDLILECEVTVEQATGDLVLELSKGVDRFRARWQLASGDCTLTRLTQGKEQELDRKPTSLKDKGKYRVRFANVDERLTIWVDDQLPFGDGVAYDQPRERGPFANDLEPASIGTKAAVVGVHHLQLWRDTYYTVTVVPSPADARVVQDLLGAARFGANAAQKFHELLSHPDQWESFRDLPCTTLYVQPEHYLCLGDNSPESADSRSWGLVPHRLVVGPALLIYYPFDRAGPIR
jgi:signal peptidase I